MIFIFRGSHTGYVCSGWFLSQGERENNNVRSVYDIDVGMFLFVIMIINAVALCCGCFACFSTTSKVTRYQMQKKDGFDPNMTAD